MIDNIFDFIGGNHGQWKILKMEPIVGETLKQAPYLKIVKSSTVKSSEGVWSLKGLISNIRYTEKEEKEKLISIQADLGRPEATKAALIPIKKSEVWWTLAQDERRKIFEAQSNHTKTGLKYLPAIARKLYHCRDIGEPFDFITFFEYAPSDSEAFEELVYSLRKTEEWKYVDREIDIRLIRE
ncbi:chlorite dismutase family protein [Confluentibacter flavum]|uniref:Chlorite dismutase n=1 Tax=Confluentibacter flavum TaxID=1909700 RepID=A0A2N3HMM3_9FLAO|nr:chlorite dismutase family protein [Confluentibacter flavum]PKQ46187.1 chlorite dismutase [Confluentibacter flavum]